MTEKYRQDMDKAEQMVRDLGTDPLQLISLNSAENFNFFGPKDCGVIFYTLAGKRALSLGDPVCRPEDLNTLIAAYADFCVKKGYRCIFNSVNKDVAQALASAGFLIAKYGQEGILDLSEYTLDGGKKGAMRRNVAKLDRYGCTCTEYNPEKKPDTQTEKEILDLRTLWFDNKKLSLTYSVGDLRLKNPCGRRYFITKDSDGNPQAVVSFLPYRKQKGWCLDVMYRNPEGLTGAMEHAIISSMNILKEDGAEELSLNIAPLAGIDPDAPNAGREEKLMHAIFDTMDYGYDFKGLYRFKEKFFPSEWRSRYLAYDPKISMITLARSIANVKGASDWELKVKYGKFLLSYTLTPGKYNGK